MLGISALEKIAHTLLSASRPAAAEVWIEAHTTGLTRFANNRIHQNVSEHNLEITLRVNLGGRCGTTSSNRSHPTALQELAESALAAARLSPPNPADPGLAAPAALHRAQAFDEATAACTPAQRAARVHGLCRQSAAAGFNAAGAYSTAAVEQFAANSNGLRAYHPFTCAEFQTTLLSEDSSGRGQGVHWQMEALPLEDLGAAALRTAAAGHNPRVLPPGDYPVILSPYAVLDIVAALNVHGANGLALHEGRSWMTGRLGTAAFSPQISLWDDGLDPSGLPLPFDGEGQPRRKVEIIRGGVVGGAVFDRASALLAGQPSTGHAQPPAARAQGALACNLFMAPGSASPEQLIAGTAAGLLITRFWYTRLVSTRDCIMTGMTRDGVFWVEHGEIAYPVKNLRFTQSYVAALARVAAVGSQAPILKAQYGEVYARVPALKLENFRFTS